MGVEARFQAIPEDCELLKLARKEYDIAEMMEHFDQYANPEKPHPRLSPESEAFSNLVQPLAKKYPDLYQRYFYAAGRNWDTILYLLSPARRIGNHENDQSLIRQAIKGSELLHPDARATQGHPIGFVPTQNVYIVANYLDSVTYEELHEHFNPAAMAQKVYKAHTTESGFQYVWEEFTGMRHIYRAAANHNEAMIVVID
jgi:hypothetical protein